MSREYWYGCADPLYEANTVINGWELDLSSQDATDEGFCDNPLAERAGERPVPVSIVPTEPARDMTNHFLAVTAPLITGDRKYTQRIPALRLSGVRLTERVRQRIRALAPLDVLDLSSYDLTAQQLLEVYQSVGARCRVILGDRSSLVSMRKLAVPPELLKHRNLSDFLAFLNRVIYQGRPWINQLTRLDLSLSQVSSVDCFQTLSGRSYLPETLTTLILDGIPAGRINLSALPQCLSITHLSINGCGFNLHHAREIVSMPSLQSVDITGNDLSQVAWLQIVAHINVDLMPIELALNEDSAQARLLCGVARKHREVILSEVQNRAGVGEAKADADAERMQTAKTLFAVSDFLRTEPTIIYNPVRKTEKTFRLTGGTSYRNLPDEHFSFVPPSVMTSLRALFPSLVELRGVEGAQLVTHMIAAQAIAFSPLITSTGKGEPTLFEGGVSLGYLHHMEERLCSELALMRASYRHYLSRSEHSPENDLLQMKMMHISELAHGAKLLLAVCRSMIEQADEVSVGVDGVLVLGERQAQAIINDQQQDLSAVSLVSVRMPGRVGAPVDAPDVVHGYARLLS